MDEMYGLHTTGDYADKALMSPENLMMIMPSDYDSYHGGGGLINSSSSGGGADHHHNRIPMFGSDDNIGTGGFQCSGISETASITPHEIYHHHQRKIIYNNEDYEEREDHHEDSCSAIKAKIASHPSYPKLIDAYIDCQKVFFPIKIASAYNNSEFFFGIFS